MKYFKETDKIVECVPNFSEGRDETVIKRICDVIENIQGVRLLHTDMGHDANRTVITFAGHPESVAEAAFSAIAMASELIDMSAHQGVHPRMGAVDVCPFIPLKNIGMEEVVRLSSTVAERTGRELGIPVYLYEHSASRTERKNMSYLRRGEYEAITRKMKLPQWEPDFGPFEFNVRSGMTAMGARNLLVAYNINLDTEDSHLANHIARLVRESGYRKNGKIHSGRIQGLKAIGWLMDGYHCAQVSTNIVDIEKAPIELVFETVSEEAERLNTSVTGSELIGLIPEQLLVSASRFYSSTTFHETDKTTNIELAINKLGLNSLSIFESEKRIIERLL